MPSIIQDSVPGPEIKHDSPNDPHSLMLDVNSENVQSKPVTTVDRRTSVTECQLDEKTDVFLSKDPIVQDVQKKEGDGHQSSTDDSAPKSKKLYLSGVPFIILTIVLMATILMTALDQNILFTATPKIATEFKIIDDIAWYHAAYGIGQMVAQPTLGKIYTYWNTKYLFLASILVFEVGSTLCAAAPNSVTLIIGRAIAGAGYGGLYTGALLIIVDAVPLHRRPLYISLVGSMSAVAAVAGPLLGGIFTDSVKLKWRFAFWINLPIGFLVGVAVWFVFHPSTPKHANLPFKEKLNKLDLDGAAVLIPGIALFQVAIQRGGALHPWNNANVWALMVVGGLLLCAFTWLQIRKGDRATIPPRIIRNRDIYTIYLFGCTWAIVLMVHLLYLPFYFQTVKNTSAIQSGIRILPYTITSTIGGAFSGIIITVTKQYWPFMFLGTLLAAVGSGLLFTLNVDSTIGHWFGYQVIAAFGYGMSVQLPLVVIQNVLEVEDIPTATAVFIFCQNFVGAITLTVAQNVFQQELQRRVGSIAGVDLRSVVESQPSEIREHVPVEFLMRVVKAFNESISTAFIISIVGACLGFLISFSVERRQLRDESKETDRPAMVDSERSST